MTKKDLEKYNAKMWNILVLRRKFNNFCKIDETLNNKPHQLNVFLYIDNDTFFQIKTNTKFWLNFYKFSFPIIEINRNEECYLNIINKVLKAQS